MTRSAARTPPAWELRQLERQQAYTDHMAVLEQIQAHLGDILDATKAPALGDVLAQQTAIIAANGFYELTWPGKLYQSVSIGNTSATDLTVAAGAAAPSGAPSQLGPGQFIVRSHIMRTVSIRGSALTIYGTVGAIFDLTVYSRQRPPSSGSC